jgi:outer membrane lipoprotein SlyB
MAESDDDNDTQITMVSIYAGSALAGAIATAVAYGGGNVLANLLAGALMGALIGGIPISLLWAYLNDRQARRRG